MVCQKHGLKLVNIGEYPVNQLLHKHGARLGARVMSELFHQLVRPMATGETLGAFLNGLRIVVIDGTCFDVPHSITFGAKK
jgi:hypothetical protein